MSLFVVIGSGVIVWCAGAAVVISACIACARGDGRFDEPEDRFDEEFLASAGVQPMHKAGLR